MKVHFEKKDDNTLLVSAILLNVVHELIFTYLNKLGHNMRAALLGMIKCRFSFLCGIVTILIWAENQIIKI